MLGCKGMLPESAEALAVKSVDNVGDWQLTNTTVQTSLQGINMIVPLRAYAAHPLS